MPVDEVRRLINAIDDHRTGFNSPPFISKKLRALINIPGPINEKKSIDELKYELKQQIRDDFEQIKDELKQQMRDEFKQQVRDEFKQTRKGYARIIK